MRLKPPHIALALVALLAFPLSAGEKSEKAPAGPAASAAASALKVHVDPATGQVVSPKSDPAAARGVSATMPAESAQPLKVEKVTTKAGGQKVNLQGRFMMESTVSIGPDGKLSQGCSQNAGAAPAAGEPVKEHRHDR
jgi:hypothetical protein